MTLGEVTVFAIFAAETLEAAFSFEIASGFAITPDTDLDFLGVPLILIAFFFTTAILLPKAIADFEDPLFCPATLTRR